MGWHGMACHDIGNDNENDNYNDNNNDNDLLWTGSISLSRFSSMHASLHKDGVLSRPELPLIVEDKIRLLNLEKVN